MNIEEVFPAVLGLIEADPVCGAVARISQLQRDYAEAYETALETAGLCFVLWAAEAQPYGGNDTPTLDLVNDLVLAVCERPKQNTGDGSASAIVWVRRLLRLLHQSGQADRRGRTLIRHPARGPAYELGELGQGLVIYLVHLEVRSVEPAGALPA